MAFAQLQRLSGVTDAQLHAVNTTAHAVPLELQEVLEDVRAARLARQQPVQDWPASFARLRQRPATRDPGAAVLVRDFPDLPVPLAERIAAQANDAERERLEGARLPLRLAEQVRLALRDVQLNRAYTDLYLPAARRVEADRLLLVGASHLPGWPAEFGLVLLEGDEGGRELTRLGPDETDELNVVLRTVAGYRLLARAGRASQDSVDLAQTLVHALSPGQWVELDLDDALWLRQRVFEQWLADRDLAARAIGQRRAPAWLRPPARQPDGAVGYALSGQGAAHIGLFRARVRQRLQRLYPRVDEPRIRVLQAGLGVEPLAALERLEAQYARLQATLAAWVIEEGAARDRHGEVVVVQPRQRRAAADDMLAAWRRETLMIAEAGDAAPRYQLILDDRTVGDLPTLDADFSHISHLALRRAGLLLDPSGFLSAFTGLRSLDLQENHLGELPQAIARMPWLTRLVMRHNRLRGRDTLFDPLAGLVQLDTLILSHNPLHVTPVALRALAQRSSLTELRLNDCECALDAEGFAQLARLQQLEELSLEDNGIVLTAGALNALGRLASLRSVSLAGNPLGETADVTALAQVRHLDLSDCGLGRWPTGLSGLMAGSALRWVSLSDNPLVDVPTLHDLAFFQGASDFAAQRLEISAQGLSATAREHLAQVAVEPVPGQVRYQLADDAPQPLVVNVSEWGEGLDARLREHLEQFNEQAAADGLLMTLDRFSATGQYQRDPAAYRRRIADVISASCTPDEEGSGQQHLRTVVLGLAETALEGGPLLYGWLAHCEGHVRVYRAGKTGAGGLAEVVAQVRQALPQGESLAPWLLTQPAWCQCVARRWPQALAKVQAPWRDGLRYLVATAHEPFDLARVPEVTGAVLAQILAHDQAPTQALVPGRSLGPQQRQQARRRLQAALEQATTAFMQRMTEKVLASPA
ncbi:leucine-rich repeat domain-containing protein [Pseudomonas putida]